MDKRGLAIIFHSGSYDRIYHGLSIAIAALALGRNVRFFFTYWALGYLRKGPYSRAGKPGVLKFDKEAELHKEILDENIKRGHMLKLTEIFKQARQMGAKFYACTNSMGLLNIARDELSGTVDKSMGITTFLTETSSDQMIFI